MAEFPQKNEISDRGCFALGKRELELRRLRQKGNRIAVNGHFKL